VWKRSDNTRVYLHSGFTNGETFTTAQMRSLIRVYLLKYRDKTINQSSTTLTYYRPTNNNNNHSFTINQGVYYMFNRHDIYSGGLSMREITQQPSIVDDAYQRMSTVNVDYRAFATYLDEQLDGTYPNISNVVTMSVLLRNIIKRELDRGEFKVLTSDVTTVRNIHKYIDDLIESKHGRQRNLSATSGETTKDDRSAN
jgi:hypothetical protein